MRSRATSCEKKCDMSVPCKGTPRMAGMTLMSGTPHWASWRSQYSRCSDWACSRAMTHCTPGCLAMAGMRANDWRGCVLSSMVLSAPPASTKQCTRRPISGWLRRARAASAALGPMPMMMVGRSHKPQWRKMARVSMRPKTSPISTKTQDTTHHRRDAFHWAVATMAMSSSASRPVRRMKSPTSSQMGLRSL